MSFGYSIGDAILLTQLAWTVVQRSRKACGEHDELTREVLSLHTVLQRLEHEVAKPESPINRRGDTCGEELEVVVSGCQRVLQSLDQALEKYNALGETERNGRQLWQKIKFGNGEMTDLANLRGKTTIYTSSLSLLLNIVSLGTVGRVEQQMNDAGGELKEIKRAVNDISAHLMAQDHSRESILTTYPDDEKAIWKEFRRELIEDGFSSSVIREHKDLIKAYVKELGSRGLLDDEDPFEASQQGYCTDPDFRDEGENASPVSDTLHDSLSTSDQNCVSEPGPHAEAYKAVSNDCYMAKDYTTAVHKRSSSFQGSIFPRAPALDTSTSPVASYQACSLEFKGTPQNVRFNLQRHLRTSPSHNEYRTSMDGLERAQDTTSILEAQGGTTLVKARLLQHYAIFKKFFAQSLRDERDNPRIKEARHKLLRFTLVQFQELSTDVYDELLRRQSSAGQQINEPGQVPSYLLPKDNFHPKRNHARQRLATLPPPNFQHLATDVVYGLEGRFNQFPRIVSAAFAAQL